MTVRQFKRACKARFGGKKNFNEKFLGALGEAVVDGFLRMLAEFVSPDFNKDGLPVLVFNADFYGAVIEQFKSSDNLIRIVDAYSIAKE